MYYRNSPEIALILLRNPQFVPEAVKVMRHFSHLGAAFGRHELNKKLTLENPELLPKGIMASIVMLTEALAKTGSMELKHDVKQVRREAERLRDISLQDWKDSVIKAKKKTQERAPVALRTDQFSHGSTKALQDEKLQQFLNRHYPQDQKEKGNKK